MLTEEEASELLDADRKIMEVIAVDDFDSSELARQPVRQAPRKAAARPRSVSGAPSRKRPTKDPGTGEKEVATGG